MEIQRAFRRNIILILCCLIGGLLIPYISIQLNPSPRSQQISVTYQYPNASPEIIEQEVTSRLESAFATLRGLKEIQSTSDIGSGMISLQFDLEVGMEKKRMEIAMLIRQIYSRLDQEVSYPQITYQSEFDEYKTLLVYTLASTLPANELDELVNEQIITPLSREAGVHKIELSGLQTEEYQVVLNEPLWKSLKLTSGVIQKAIRQQLSYEELGLATVGKDARKTLLPIRYGPSGLLQIPEQLLLNTPIAQQSGRTILLSDIAKVQRRRAKPLSYYRINGREAVNLVIYADQNSNQIELAARLKKEIAGLAQDLERVIHLDLVQDETEFLSEELRKIAWRIGATFSLLLLFMVLVCPQVRYLLVIWLSLMASLLIAIIFYYGLGLPLHLYSIAGWTLSIGIVLDNLIVMVDHIRHYGNQRIFPAIFAATLTTIGAVSVVFFMEEQYRESLSDFSWIFMVNLLVSLLVALIFVPALSHTFFQKQEVHRFSVGRKRRVLQFTKTYRRFILFGSRFRVLFLLSLTLTFGLPLFLLPKKMEGEKIYSKWYNQSLGSTYFQRTIRPPLEKYLGGTLRLFHQKKNQFYFKQQKQEKTRLYMRAKMPFGGTMEQLNEVIQLVEAELDQYAEIDKYETRINGPDQSTISITFKDAFEKGLFPYFLKDRLELLAVETGSADFGVYGVGQGFNNEIRGTNLSVQIQLLGYQYEELWRLGQLAKDNFLKHLRIQKAFLNAERTYYEPTEEYYQLVLPQMADLQQSQLTPRDIGRLLYEAKVEKGNAGFVAWDKENYPVYLYSSDERQNQLWNLQNRPFTLDSNQVYKHTHYLKLRREQGQQKIVRLNQQYQLILSYDFIGNPRLGQRVMKQKLDTISQQFPVGYTIQDMGHQGFWGSKKSIQQLLQILMVAVVLIFMINAILFNSIRQAFIPLLLVFPAYIGVFLCVSIFDFRFDQGGFASFLLVAGLSVNAALFIINDYNNYRQRRPHLSELECFIKAFNAKIIPIILTTLSTVLGLLPFVLFDAHQTFWYSLAICTIGGLVFSTLAVYLFFPIMFLRKRIKR